MRITVKALCFAPPLALTVLLVLPVLAGLAGVIAPSFGYLPWLGFDDLSLGPWQDLFTTPGLAASVHLSLRTGLISAFGALAVVALFLAAFHDTALFRIARRCLSPLLSIPHAAAALGLAFLVAPSGFLMRLLSPGLTGFTRPQDYLLVHDPAGLTLAAGLIAKEVPFLFLVALAAMPQVDIQREKRIADSFGYGRMAGWLFVVFPQIYRQIRLPVLAVLAYSVSVVDMAIILGPTTPPTLAVRLVEWMNDPDLSMRLQASAGALLQLALAGLAVAIWMIGERIVSAVGGVLIGSGRRYRRDGVMRGLAAGLMAIAMASVALGLATLALWSIAGSWRFPAVWPDTFTTRIWRTQFDEIGTAVQTTLLIAIPAVLVGAALVLATLEARDRAGEKKALNTPIVLALYAPLLVPQVAFLFGLQILFLKVGFDSSWSAVVLVHLVFVIPYVMFSLIEPWQAWDRRYALVVQALGRGRAALFWQVRLPMLFRAVLTAIAVGFAVSVSQYLPTLLIGGGRWATITTEAVALSAGGNRRVIGAYALMQMVLPFIGFALAAAIPALLFRNRRGLAVGG